jgi:hypothetical protein
MRKTALLAAAAAMMAASPAAAHGYLGLSYGNSELDLMGTSADLDQLRVDGAFGFSGERWGAQIGADIGNVDGDAGDDDFYALNGHLFYQGGSWRLGGLVNLTEIDDASETVYGLEGMFDVTPNANLWASATLGDVEGDVDLSNFDFGGNFYATPNVRLGANFGFGEIDSTASVDTTSYGINGEFQPFSMPLSFTASWSAFEIDDVDVESNHFLVGVRWNFGGGTLQERDEALPFNQQNTGYISRMFGIN